MNLNNRYRIAQLWKRLVAAAVDMLLCYVASSILLLLLKPLIDGIVAGQIAGAPRDFGAFSPSYETQAIIGNSAWALSFLLVFVLVGITYHVVFEMTWNTTLGKRLLGLRLADSSSLGRIVPSRATVRILAKSACNPFIMFFAGAYCGALILPFVGSNFGSMAGLLIASVFLLIDMSAMVKSRQRLAFHDSLAQTVVIASAPHVEYVFVSGTGADVTATSSPSTNDTPSEAARCVDQEQPVIVMGHDLFPRCSQSVSRLISRIPLRPNRRRDGTCGFRVG